jgi:hypothetical protein
MAFDEPKYFDDHPLIGQVVDIIPSRLINTRFYEEEGYVNYYFTVYKVYGFNRANIAWCHVHQLKPGHTPVSHLQHGKVHRKRYNLGLEQILPVELKNKNMKSLLSQEG